MAKEAVAKKSNSTKKDVTIEEMIENLQAQHKQYAQTAKEAETMALKSLGAIEVLMGINENVKNNGEA